MALPRTYYFQTEGTDIYGNLFPQRVLPENWLLPVERQVYPVVPSHLLNGRYPLHGNYYYGPPTFRKYIDPNGPTTVKVVFNNNGTNETEELSVPYKYVDKFLGDVYMASLVRKESIDDCVEVKISTEKYKEVSFKVPKLQLNFILKDPRYNAFQYFGPGNTRMGLHYLINKLVDKMDTKKFTNL